MLDKSFLTAIGRKKISRPTLMLFEAGKLRGKMLDYGCGRSVDLTTFSGADRYDPFYWPLKPVWPYDTIICHYVLNVIPYEPVRDLVINTVHDLLQYDGCAYFTVRRDKKKLNGWTKRGTWQGWVELDLPIFEENSNFCIYEMKRK